jgi:hypothetical protein
MSAFIIFGWLLLGLIPAASSANPSLLVVSALGRPDVRFLKEIREAGFEVDYCRPDEVSWKRLKGFNVVVLVGLGHSNADFSVPPNLIEKQKLYLRFVEEGGGLFVWYHRGENLTDVPPMRSLLKPLGATILLERVSDPQTEVRATVWNLKFAYTEEIEKSPLTEGVEGLWYAVATWTGGTEQCLPLSVDENWRMIVRGGRWSKSKPLHYGAPQIDGEMRERGYEGFIPLFAVREFGKGRAALTGINPVYSFLGGKAPALEGIALEEGLLGRPSGLKKLILNTLRWLAEPSMRLGKFGGAKTNPEKLRPPYLLNGIPSFDWSKTRFEPPKPIFKGIVGARTVFSTGRGTVKDWVEATRQTGLDFIVFLEEFGELTEEEFRKLKEECRRFTDDGFAAIPGFTIQDQLGNRYFAMGEHLLYPPELLLTPDGKKLGVNLKAVGKHIYELPELGDVILHYTHGLQRFRMHFGFWLTKKAAIPHYDFRDVDSMAVFVQRGGELLEEALSAYLEQQDSGQNLAPFALTLIHDPAELAGWVRERGFLTALQVSGIPELVKGLSDWHPTMPPYQPRQFVTNGPLIEEWRWIGPRDYACNGEWFRWSHYRWRLRLVVSSDVGLKEVKIIDGTQLFRRFLPKGRKRFEVEFDLHHDRQHNLVVIAIDKRERIAVSAEAYDRNHLAEEFMCGDRNNQLTYGLLRHEDGTALLIGGNQNWTTPNKGPRMGEVNPAGIFKNDWRYGTAVPGFDGAPGGEPPVFFIPYLRTPKGELTEQLHVKAERVLHTADVHIGQGTTDGTFPEGVKVYNVWHTIHPVIPSNSFEIRDRIYFFNVKPDPLPVSVFLIEEKVRVKRDIPLDGKALMPIRLGFVDVRKAEMWTIRSADEEVWCGGKEEPPRSRDRYVMGDFGYGAYATFYPSPLGSMAVISLTDGLRFWLDLPRTWRLYFGPVPKDDVIPAGTTFRLRMLLLGLPRTAPPTNEIVERYRSAMGFLGEHAVEVAIENGEMLERSFWLRVDGKGIGFAGIVKGTDLPTTLPVVVEGMNDRWTTVLYDRRRRQLRPIGCVEGKAYAVVDPSKGDLDLFVGHPVVCDDPDLFLTFVQTDGSGFSLEIHNPTNEAREISVEPAPWFDLIEVKPSKLKIPPGSSVFITIGP